METIDRTIACLKWLETEGSKGTNIVAISRKLDELSLLSVHIGKMTTDAYRTVSEVEDDYDIEYAKRFTKLTETKSAASAKPQVEAELGEKKKELTKAKANYRKLDCFLDRLDKVMETHRQSISVMKLDAKHI